MIFSFTSVKQSFTIFFITTDSGYEGPQSRINKLSSLCSLTNINAYTISTKNEIDRIIPEMTKPGVKMITISQKMFKNVLIDLKINKLIDNTNFLYEYFNSSNKNLLLSTNFCLENYLKVKKIINSSHSYANIFNQNFIFNNKILNYLKNFKKIILLSDAKSLNFNLLDAIQSLKNVYFKTLYFRENTENLYPNNDRFLIDTIEIDNFFK
jgi:hypothetical protein